MSGIVKFSVKSVRTDSSGRLRRVVIRRKMESSRDLLTTNEMPLIMAAFKGLVMTERNNQFTYAFPFNLS